ncbi:hypothetical protein ACJU26_09840 [Acidithiobacillus sp. M4-SHS-6]|uniref:hypothetical protein n=1 Tax=Acidithiobacillus sp. M4-SHS-6 TaxID=3383024 RepID=UPI0039BE751E
MPTHSFALIKMQTAAVLIGRWPAFVSWLVDHRSELSERLMFIHRDPDIGSYCPIHIGESGEAFHVYTDFEDTGGAVCNSCGGFSDGCALFERIYAAADLDKALFYEDAATWLQAMGLECPAEAEAAALWDWIHSLDAEYAVKYLRFRGITGVNEESLPRAIRASAATESDPPIMRTLLSKEGRPLTVLRTYLADTGLGLNPNVRVAKRLYPVSRPRIASQGYFDLSAPGCVSPILYTGEGVESMMAIRAIVEDAHIHAQGGAANRYGKIYVPEGITTIHLCAERDGTLDNLKKSVATLRERGYSVHVHIPPEMENGTDWLDYLTEVGITTMARVFQETSDARYGSGDQTPSIALPTPLPNDTGTPTNAEPEVPPLEFNLNNPDADLFAYLDKHLPLFKRDSWFLHLRIPETVPVKLLGAVLEPLGVDDLMAAISEKIAFFMESSNGNFTYMQTPRGRIANWFNSAYARGVLDQNLRVLRDVVLSPTVVSYMPEGRYSRKAYRFLKEPGYDPVSKYYLCADDFELNCLRRAQLSLENREHENEDTLSEEDIEGYFAGDLHRKSDEYARNWDVPDSLRERKGLINQVRKEFLCHLPVLMEDFHFATISDYANMLAMFLSPLLTTACDNIPFFMVQAPARGAGKTTLVQAFGNLWGGVMQIAAPDSDDEMEKRMGTAFTTGKRMVLFDNLNRLDSPSLTNLLTSGGSYEVRKLGGNQSLRMPPGLLLLGTGNNPVIQHELARRIVFIDLDPPRDIVTSRIEFRYPDLPGYVQLATHQVTIKQALYTCLLVWEKLGFPILGDTLDVNGFIPKFESFTDFAKLVTSFLYLFFPGNLYRQFLDNQKKYLDADAESDEISQFVSGWVKELSEKDLPRCIDKPDWFPVSSLVQLSERLQVPSTIIEYRHTEAGKTRRLGMWLSRLSNRRFPLESGNWRIVRYPTMLPYPVEDGAIRRSRAYCLERVD